MGYHDVQQVCLNGHQITDNYNRSPEFRRAFCNKCGAATIHKCPECHADIRGEYHVEGVAVISAHTAAIPTFCEKCGKPFPWASERSSELDAVTRLQPLDAVERICKRFPLVVRQMRNRHDSRDTLDVQDEYDVQDVLHSLLLLFFDDVRAEEYTPSYAGKSTRMDFLLKTELTVIEAKMTRRGLGVKEVGEQLIVDIAHYQTHPECRRLVCFIYDPDHRIANPRGLEKDLSKKHDKLDVSVFVVPRDH